MSYLVLARKYRPKTFDQLIGQGHITDILKKSIEQKRIAHAFLFCGPRGVGKTSTARILAKSFNCEKGPTLSPCGTCSSCTEITAGNSFDVIEIDGASNRGIDEIRTLRENVKFAPAYGRFKIYIVDEVHMLVVFVGRHQTCHHRVIGDMQAVGKFTLVGPLIEIGAQSLDPVLGAIEHQAQVLAGAGEDGGVLHHLGLVFIGVEAGDIQPETDDHKGEESLVGDPQHHAQ